MRHSVNTLLGFLGMTYFFGWDVIHVAAMALVTWLILAFAPRQKVHIWVCAVVFAYLSACHIHTVIYRFGRYDLEITTNTMLLTLRLQALGFAYSDGAKDPALLTERQKTQAVRHLPTLLEVFSFSFFVQQCALGVFFEFRDFKCWAEQTDEYKSVPNPIVESLKYFLTGVCTITIFLFGSSHFPCEACWGDEFPTWSLSYKMMFSFLSWAFKRYFYYTAFSFQTGTIIASGLGYNGKVVTKDKIEHKWDKTIGVYIWDAEFATNASHFLKAWNHRVHVWLKFYVADRLTGKDNKPSTMDYFLTYMTSAFWHGFYPFYYVAFVGAAMA